MRLSRPLRTALVGALALVGVVVATALALAPPPYHSCRSFGVNPAEWRAADGRRRETIVKLIVHCRTLVGATRATVYRTLGRGGRPLGEWHPSGSHTFAYTDLRVRFGADGRVTRAWSVGATD